MPSLPSPELLVDLLLTLGYVGLAAVLAVGGTIVEYTSYQYVAAGDTTVALWLAALGAVMLYAGVYGIGYQKLLATRRDTDA